MRAIDISVRDIGRVIDADVEMPGYVLSGTVVPAGPVEHVHGLIYQYTVTKDWVVVRVVQSAEDYYPGVEWEFRHDDVVTISDPATT